MYERFTDRARKVMELAEEEAHRLGCKFVHSEHVLVGLIREGAGVGAHVLTSANLDLQKIRAEVEKLRENGALSHPQDNDAELQLVVKLSLDEAQLLKHRYSGTEHLLLAVDRPELPRSTQVLTSLGVNPAEIREEVLNLLGHGLD